MTYFIHPILFYLAEIGESIKCFSLLFGLLALGGSIVYYFVFKSDYYDDEDNKNFLKKTKFFAVIGAVLLAISILIPTKATCIEMIIASKITNENITSSKEEIREFIDYITDALEEVNN